MQGILSGDFAIRLLDTGVQAAVIFCVLLLARAVFSLCKVPRKLICLMWIILFARLILPSLPESPLGLWTKDGAQPFFADNFGVSFADAFADEEHIEEHMIEGAGNLLGGAERPYTREEPYDNRDARTAQGVWRFLVLVWATGCMAFLLYGGISVLLLKKKLRCSIKKKDGCYLADGIPTAFVMGVFLPKIYLPSDLEEEDMAYVVLHERLHIRRGDYLMKAAAYVVTCFYWFHPLVWAALYLFGKDIEMACDEAVMNELGESGRHVYADTLLRLSAGKNRFAGVPLAFGEGSVESRIRHIVKYKRPAAGAAVLGAAAVLILGAGLLTGRQGQSPVPDGMELPSGHIVKCSAQTTVTIDGETYDMAELCSSVNGLMPEVRELGKYIVIEGHISPNCAYYGFFNTESREWEWGYTGTFLTWDENWEMLEDPIESVIYAEDAGSQGVIRDWKTNGIAIYDLEDEYIRGLRRVGDDITLTLVNYSGDRRELKFDFKDR